MRIIVLNTVESVADKELIPLIKPALRYTTTWFKQGGWLSKNGKRMYVPSRKVRNDAFFINSKGIFLTGFLIRVYQYCKKQNIPVEFIGLIN